MMLLYILKDLSDETALDILCGTQSSRVKLVNKIGEIICTQSRREMFVLWDLENQALDIGKHVFDGNFGPYMQKFLELQFQLKPSGHAHQDVACNLMDLVFVWVFWCFPLN